MVQRINPGTRVNGNKHRRSRTLKPSGGVM
nr:MAG TPA: hypothetical protein [Bacteriophage sp.]